MARIMLFRSCGPAVATAAMIGGPWGSSPRNPSPNWSGLQWPASCEECQASCPTRLELLRKRLKALGIWRQSSVTPLIVDHDGGLDDYAALAILFNRMSRVELLLVTTVGGACQCSKFSSQLSKKFLAASGHDHVPVVEGANAPTQGGKPPPWLQLHQQKLSVAAKWWGLREEQSDENCTLTSSLESDALAERAATAIIEAAEKYLQLHKRKVKILSLGPLTNIAYAVDHLPQRLRASVSEIVVAADMCSKKTTEGEIANVFNVRLDRASFDKVMNCGVPITLCRPTNICREWRPLSSDLESVAEQSFSARVISTFAASNVTKLPPLTGGEHVHLKQDPLVAFFIVQPAAFSLSPSELDAAGHIRRANEVDLREYEQWMWKAICEKALP